MIRALALLTMLLPADSAALQGSRLLPNAQGAIGQSLSVRAVTLDTGQNQSYPASADSVILTYTFPAGVLLAGSQCRMLAYGTFLNTDVVTDSFSPSVIITQAASTQAIGILYANPIGTMSWVIDADVSFNMPAQNSKSKYPPGQYVSGIKSNASLAVGAMVRYNARKAGTFNQDLAVTPDPNSLLVTSTSPVRVDLSINTGNTTTFNVFGGWLECM